MTNSEILSLVEALSKVSSLTGSKFSYAVARNIAILNPEVIKFEEARKALLNSFSKKDKEGKAEVKDNQYVLEDQEGFAKEFQKLAKEEVVVSLFKIEMNELPEGISGEQTIGIYPIIVDKNPVEQPI